jgi:hypothetical protein
VRGELYPIKKTIFAETYDVTEPLEEEFRAAEGSLDE